MAEITSTEQRIRALEAMLVRLARRVASLQAKQGDGGGGNGSGGQPTFYRAQVTSPNITATSSGNVLGTGTVRILQVLGTTPARYQLSPDLTVTAYNDTGSSLVQFEYCIVALVDGLFTVIVGDCATSTPTAAPTPPP